MRVVNGATFKSVRDVLDESQGGGFVDNVGEYRGDEFCKGRGGRSESRALGGEGGRDEVLTEEESRGVTQVDESKHSFAC